MLSVFVYVCSVNGVGLDFESYLHQSNNPHKQVHYPLPLAPVVGQRAPVPAAAAAATTSISTAEPPYPHGDDSDWDSAASGGSSSHHRPHRRRERQRTLSSVPSASSLTTAPGHGHAGDGSNEGQQLAALRQALAEAVEDYALLRRRSQREVSALRAEVAALRGSSGGGCVVGARAPSSSLPGSRSASPLRGGAGGGGRRGEEGAWRRRVVELEVGFFLFGCLCMYMYVCVGPTMPY